MNVIIVIDPHPVLRLGLAELLGEKHINATILTEGYSVFEQEKPTEPLPCSLVLLTLSSVEPPCPYLERLSQFYSPQFILLFDEHRTHPTPAFFSHQPLVHGLISKESSPDLIRAAVRLVLAGGTCFPNVIPTVDTPTPTPPTVTVTATTTTTDSGFVFTSHPNEAELLGLTKRQYEVLVLLAEGFPLKTIAKQLNISVATAKSHTESLYQRLNVNNRNAAVYTAVNMGASLCWTQ